MPIPANLRLVLVNLLAMVPALRCQSWNQLAPATSPPARSETTMAWTRGYGALVMFGGRSGATARNDTWLLNFQGIWTRAYPTTNPAARFGHMLAYMNNDRGTILLGGRTASGTVLNDCWYWDSNAGSYWVQANPGPTRYDGAMGFFVGQGRMLMHGGRSTLGGPALSDTWEFISGYTWLQRWSPGPARYGHRMVYYPWLNRMAISGGTDGTTYFSDLWIFDANDTWQLLPASNPPPGRAFHNITADLQRGRLVMSGGTDGTNTLSDTWEFDGSTWVQVSTTTPGARSHAAAFYNYNRYCTMLFGGDPTGAGTQALADTWEFTQRTTPGFGVFAPGCAGANGIPTFVESGPAYVNSSYVIRMQSFPSPRGLTVGLFSPSRSSWSGGPLPHDLTSIGMPGCQLLVRPDVLVPLVSSSWQIGLPGEKSLIGLTIYLQAMTLDAAANALGVLASDGLQVDIGAR
ncbi:MAG: hypothetical protein KDC98_06455 [Planctomycetes bacterium]|nr:hypothetical protein [Planctomycetota bacterium]